jgi:hypothetical protein
MRRISPILYWPFNPYKHKLGPRQINLLQNLVGLIKFNYVIIISTLDLITDTMVDDKSIYVR